MPGLKSQSKWAKWTYWTKRSSKLEKGLKKKVDPESAHYALNQLLVAWKAKGRK